MVLTSASLDVVTGSPSHQQQYQQSSLPAAAVAAAATTKSVATTTFTTRAYYRDSSGRARVHLRLRLSNHGNDNDDEVDGGLHNLLKCGCILPAPVESSSFVSVSPDEEVEVPSNSSPTKAEPTTDWTLSFECTSSPTPQVATTTAPPLPSPTSSCCWAVEGVTILRCEIERMGNNSSSMISALLFDIEIAVCGNGVGIVQKTNNDTDASSESLEDAMLEEGILTLCAALRRRARTKNIEQQHDTSTTSSAMSQALLRRDDAGGMIANLLGIDHKNATVGANIIRTTPIHIRTTLIPSLQLHVREVCGARSPSGSTLVEITVEHASRWHQENVVVTGISFHPGQSRLLHGGGDGAVSDNNESSETTTTKQLGGAGGKSMQGGELSVIDMSRRVRWGFVPGSAPDLPMTLEPYEAFATVIQIDAGEDVRSRAFVSPISVNAIIPRDASDSSSGGGVGERILITTDARWTSSRVGIENSDAFRVDLSLRGGSATVCRVGAPLVISLRILNLSMEPRDLMLLMAKDDEKRNRDMRCEQAYQQSGRDGASIRRRGIRRVGVRNGCGYFSQQQAASSQQSSKSTNVFNTAVVSEVNGYTFGVWGLSGEDDGTTRHHRDHELLAVDAALLLGEVKGQHSIQAELRFVPLREGTLDVPNLKLFDKRELKWYNCMHTLKIVATQSN